MGVYETILEWSQGLPLWQRDALRRLCNAAELSHEDILELVAICEGEYQITHDAPGGRPLTAGALPLGQSSSGALSLLAVDEVQGIDLLGGPLEFAPAGMTAVIGENGTGKSGFARILKACCRARGSEPTLRGSVFETPSAPPSATIRFTVGGDEKAVRWPAESDRGAVLGAVSVFDATAADVYVGTKTNVAYAPAGLELLPRLVVACNAVKAELTRRQEAGVASLPPLPSVKAGTSAAAFLAGISTKTKVGDIEAACTFTEQKEKRKRELMRELAEVDSEERKAQVIALRQRADRLEKVAARVEKLSIELHDERVARVRAARQEADDRRVAAEASAETEYAGLPVQPVGTRLWRLLVESAASYFEEEVSPGNALPSGEHCVLCQQTLSREASERLADFQAFLTGSVRDAAQDAEQKLRDERTNLAKLETHHELFDLVHDEFNSLDPRGAKQLQTFLAASRARQEGALAALETGMWGSLVGLPESPADALRSHNGALLAKAETLASSADQERVDALHGELEELYAEEQIAVHAEAVKAHWREISRSARYSKAVKSCSTAKITRKNGELTTHAVTEPLVQAFADEIGRLGGGALPVVFASQGARKGEQQHQVEVEGALSPTPSGRIASAGEARIIALANFLTELATAPTNSAIVLDDPSAHLDRRNAELVARRLAEESVHRQIIVFTHDTEFTSVLQEICDQRSIPLRSIVLRRDANTTGLMTA